MGLERRHVERNAPEITPRERARICEAIRRQIALEYLHGKASKREAWARIAIGLRPSRRVFSDGTSIRNEP
jgi:hypothetical protein